MVSKQGNKLFHSFCFHLPLLFFLITSLSPESFPFLFTPLPFSSFSLSLFFITFHHSFFSPPSQDYPFLFPSPTKSPSYFILPSPLPLFLHSFPSLDLLFFPLLLCLHISHFPLFLPLSLLLLPLSHLLQVYVPKMLFTVRNESTDIKYCILISQDNFFVSQ